MNPQFQALGVTAAPSAGIAPTAPQQPQQGQISSDFAALGVQPTSAPQTPSATPPQASQTPQNPTPAPSGGVLSPWAPSTGTEGPIAAAGHVAANLIPSAVNTGVGLLKMPFQMAGDIGAGIKSTAAGIPSKGLIPSLTDAVENKMPSYLYNALMPDIAKQGIMALAGTITRAISGAGLADKSGLGVGQGMVNSARTKAQADIENDPVNSIAPFLIATRAGMDKMGYGAEFDKAVSSVASPVTAVGSTVAKLGSVPGALGKFGFGQMSGLEPHTLEQIAANPSAFSKTSMLETNRASIAGEVEGALKQMESDMKETGKQYNPIRNATVEVPPEPGPTPEDIQAETGRSTAKVTRLIDAANQQADAGMWSQSEGMLRSAIRTARDENVDFPVKSVSERALDAYTHSRAMKRLEPLDPENPPKAVPRPPAEPKASTQEPASFPVPQNYLRNLIMKNSGLSFEDGKFHAPASSQLSPADVSKLNRDVMGQFQPAFDTGKLTHNEYLNLRSRLADIANYEGGFGKSEPLESAASRMRGQMNTDLRKKVPGLEELDAKFAPQIEQFNELKKGILDKAGKLTDTGINRIANGANDTRSVFNTQLEKIVPGITAKIKILSAIKDIEKAEGQKVGTYARNTGALISGGAGYAIGGIPMAIVGTIAEMLIANPKVSVPLVRMYGASSNLIGGVKAYLGEALNTVNNSPDLATGQKTIGQLAPKTASYFEKNPPSIGLSLKETPMEYNEANPPKVGDEVKAVAKDGTTRVGIVKKNVAAGQNAIGQEQPAGIHLHADENPTFGANFAFKNHKITQYKLSDAERAKVEAAKAELQDGHDYMFGQGKYAPTAQEPGQK